LLEVAFQQCPRVVEGAQGEGVAVEVPHGPAPEAWSRAAAAA